MPCPPPQQERAAAAGEPAGGKELLRELRSQNLELQKIKQQLEAAEQELKAKAAAPAPVLVAPPPPPVAAPAAPAPEPAPAPAPAAVPAAPAEEEEGGSAFAALNLVGILAAGGLYGYLSIQKKQAAEAEVAYQQKLESGAGLCCRRRRRRRRRGVPRSRRRLLIFAHPQTAVSNRGLQGGLVGGTGPPCMTGPAAASSCAHL